MRAQAVALALLGAVMAATCFARLATGGGALMLVCGLVNGVTAVVWVVSAVRGVPPFWAAAVPVAGATPLPLVPLAIERAPEFPWRRGVPTLRAAERAQALFRSLLSPEEARQWDAEHRVRLTDAAGRSVQLTVPATLIDDMAEEPRGYFIVHPDIPNGPPLCFRSAHLIGWDQLVAGYLAFKYGDGLLGRIARMDWLRLG